MTGYQTQQRNLLVSFFESHPDEALTIDEITHKMRSEQGDAAPSSKRSSAYQYCDPHVCEDHLHIRCEKCHALMHLDANVSETIAKLLKSDANVSLDIGNTILLGCCDKCSHQK